MFHQALGLGDDHFRHLHVARRRFVEGGAHHLSLDRARHVGDLFGPLVDEQHDQVAFRVVGGHRVGDVLQHHRLAGARRGDDQRPLALADGGDEVDDPCRGVMDLRSHHFHHQPVVRIERRQVVEVDAVADMAGFLEIDVRHLEQGEIPLPVLGRADFPFHRVPGAQAETPDLAWRDVDVVRSRQIIGLRRAQETEAVLQHLQHPVPEDGRVVLGQMLEDGEHHVLLAQGAGVFDLQVLGKGKEVAGSLGLEFLEIHFRPSCLAAREGKRRGANTVFTVLSSLTKPDT